MYQIRRQWFVALCLMTALGLSNGQYDCNSTSEEYVTIKGSVPPGTPCCFPFVYRGVTYNECTKMDHHLLWCAVENVYREDHELWGNCRHIATPAPTPAPTSAMSTTVTTDTPIDASNLPSQMHNCNVFDNNIRSQEYATQGGTAPSGTPCCFPFFYRHQLYYECTTRDRNQPWCAVESIYKDNYTLWGNCKWSQLTVSDKSSTSMPSPTTQGSGTLRKYIPALAVSLFLLIGIVIIVVCIVKKRKTFCQKAEAANEGVDLNDSQGNPGSEEYSYIDHNSIPTVSDHAYENQSLPKHESNNCLWQGSQTVHNSHSNSSPGMHKEICQERTSKHEYESLHRQSPTSPSNICMSVEYLTPPSNQG